MDTGQGEEALLHHICNLSKIKKAEEDVGYMSFEKYNKAKFSILKSYNVFLQGLTYFMDLNPD